ncbi:MAG: hypothetical protein PV353_09615, partial [Bartonella sp.]|nr:hypothetical protein [Bartonella sp.]
ENREYVVLPFALLLRNKISLLYANEQQTLPVAKKQKTYTHLPPDLKATRKKQALHATKKQRENRIVLRCLPF